MESNSGSTPDGFVVVEIFAGGMESWGWRFNSQFCLEEKKCDKSSMSTTCFVGTCNNVS